MEQSFSILTTLHLCCLQIVAISTKDLSTALDVSE
jgi:hypothetical protein